MVGNGMNCNTWCFMLHGRSRQVKPLPSGFHTQEPGSRNVQSLTSEKRMGTGHVQFSTFHESQTMNRKCFITLTLDSTLNSRLAPHFFNAKHLRSMGAPFFHMSSGAFDFERASASRVVVLRSWPWQNTMMMKLCLFYPIFQRTNCDHRQLLPN